MSSIKQCSQKSVNAKDPNYICNPLTGRWIIKSGQIYKDLVSKGIILADATTVSIAPIKVETIAEIPKKEGEIKLCSQSSKLSKDPNYVCNPLTGRWIKKGSNIYYELINKGLIKDEGLTVISGLQEPSTVQKIQISAFKACPSSVKKGFVCDPLSGQWVKKCGPDYQNLLENGVINKKGEIIIPENSKIEKSLSDYVKYKYPIFNYKPLSQTKIKSEQISILTINNWISEPEVRKNLLNNMTLTVYSEYYPKGNKKLENVEIFKSPYMEEYINYIQDELLEVYMNEMTSKKISIDSSEGDYLRSLVKAGLGFLPPSKNDYITVLTQLFPQAQILPQPDIGNCYYCSIGANLNKTEEEIRADIVKILQTMPKEEYSNFVEAALQSCPESSKYKKQYILNKQQFVEKYTQLLINSCKIGDQDCNDCIWGGNYFDPILSVLYDMPILSISVGSGVTASDMVFELDESSNLSAALIDAAERLDMIEVDEANEEWDDIEIGEDETALNSKLIVPSYSMAVIMQYALPISEASDEDKENYLNQYTGPFISYLFSKGKAHIDAIDFGQIKPI